MTWKAFTEKVRQGDALDSLLVANSETLPTYDYTGGVAPSGAWVIIRITIATMVFEYAWGDSDYATNWTNRALLTYAPPPQG